MMRFNEYLLIALLCATQFIGDLHAAPNGETSFSNANGTTTAVPLYNVSKSTASGHTPTVAVTMKTIAAVMSDSQSTTKTSFDSKSIILAKATTIEPSSMIPASTASQNEMDKRFFDTTTAAPPLVQRVPTDYHFDALSFMGGSLLTICLVVVATMVWKMYIAHVERRYWTL